MTWTEGVTVQGGSTEGYSRVMGTCEEVGEYKCVGYPKGK